MGTKIELDQSVPDRDCGRLTAVCRAKLAHQVGDVCGDRALPDKKLFGDLGICQALAKEREHFCFAAREVELLT